MHPFTLTSDQYMHQFIDTVDLDKHLRFYKHTVIVLTHQLCTMKGKKRRFALQVFSERSMSVLGVFSAFALSVLYMFSECSISVL